MRFVRDPDKGSYNHNFYRDTVLLIKSKNRNITRKLMHRHGY